MFRKPNGKESYALVNNDNKLETSIIGTITETNSAAILADTASLDSKIIACNTGAVVVSSGTITETNSSAILADTASLDSKITACNTGAVVVSSGAITETNSAAILADTASLDSKITQGNDSSLTNAQQVLVYGSGNGSLHPIKITPSGVIKTEEVVSWNTTELLNGNINFGASATTTTFDLGTDIHVPDDIVFFITNSASVDATYEPQVSYNGTNWFEVNMLQGNPQTNGDVMLSLINDFEATVVRYVRIAVSNNSSDTNSTFVINASTYNG